MHKLINEKIFYNHYYGKNKTVILGYTLDELLLLETSTFMAAQAFGTRVSPSPICLNHIVACSPRKTSQSQPFASLRSRIIEGIRKFPIALFLGKAWSGCNHRWGFWLAFRRTIILITVHSRKWVVVDHKPMWGHLAFALAQVCGPTCDLTPDSCKLRDVLICSRLSWMEAGSELQPSLVSGVGHRVVARFRFLYNVWCSDLSVNFHCWRHVWAFGLEMEVPSFLYFARRCDFPVMNICLGFDPCM